MQVILVMVECLRSDHLHCYGYERETSPVIDSMVTDPRGIMWTNCKSVACETAGTFAHVRYVAKKMMQARRPPVRALFSANSHGMDPLARNHVSFPMQELYRMNAPGQNTSPLADRITGATVKSLRAQKNFFAVVHYSETHLPYQAYGRGNQFVDDNQFKRDVVRLNSRPRAVEIAKYDGAIQFVDAHLKILLDTFPEAEFFVTGDHGEGFWERNDLPGHGYGMFDELTHVPLVARSPQPINLAHRVMNEPTDHLVLFDTILSRFGIMAAHRLPWPYEDDETVKERLRGLGYLGRGDDARRDTTNE